VDNSRDPADHLVNFISRRFRDQQFNSPNPGDRAGYPDHQSRVRTPGRLALSRGFDEQFQTVCRTVGSIPTGQGDRVRSAAVMAAASKHALAVTPKHCPQQATLLHIGEALLHVDL
jgi:hypothetical protein